MNANTFNCFNKLIMQSAFLLKLFSNYHQTSTDMNTNYEYYRVNKFQTFFISSFVFPRSYKFKFPLSLNSPYIRGEVIGYRGGEGQLRAEA